MALLESLGPRIAILGPSNSGKSTLAQAIARQRGLPVVHLDQLFHQPHTNWQARPTDEFVRLHDEAIAQERWVMDGNYSRCMPQRLARATGLIVLDVSTPTSLLRYLRRCWQAGDRAGGLEGGRDSVKWDMIRHITIATPKNRQHYAQLFEQSPLPKVSLRSAAEIAQFYQQEGLQR